MKKKRDNKSFSALYNPPSNSQGLTLISTEWSAFFALLSVQSKSSFHFWAGDKIKITTSAAVFSVWDWWRATYISFIRPTPSEMGQVGLLHVVFYCAVLYGVVCSPQSSDSTLNTPLFFTHCALLSQSAASDGDIPEDNQDTRRRTLKVTCLVNKV